MRTLRSQQASLQRAGPRRGAARRDRRELVKAVRPALFALYQRTEELEGDDYFTLRGSRSNGLEVASWDKAWRTVRAKDAQGKYASPSIAVAWDKLKRSAPNFVYVPVKPHEHEGRRINPVFVDARMDALVDLPRFRVDRVEERWREEAALQGIFRKGALVEYLLRRNYPILCNQGGHTRVAVYSDQDRILCVDSHGKGHQEGTSEWYWKAGYSVIDKWRFYSDVKEICFFDKPMDVSPSGVGR